MKKKTISSDKCLMIETRDKRKFLTHEKNFKELIEFASTFGAEISTVTVQTGKVLDLSPLACAISDGSYADEPVVDIIEKRFPCQETPVQEAGKLKDFVKKTFLAYDIVYLHDIIEKFKEETNYSGMSNTLHRIRKELKAEGHEIIKIGAGRYRLAKNPVAASSNER